MRLLKIQIVFISLFLTVSCVLISISASGAETGNLKVSKSDNGIVIENSATGVTLSIDGSTGVYRVESFDRTWIGDGVVAIRLKDRMMLNITPDGKPSDDMKIIGMSDSTGEDKAGGYHSVKLEWKADGLAFTTEFRVYNDVAQIKFLHGFPEGFKAQKTFEFGDTSLNFPVFIADDSGNDLNLFSYNYQIWPKPQFNNNVKQTLSIWGNGDIRVPLAIFDKDRKTGVLVPFNDYMIRTVRALDLEDDGYGPAIAAGLIGDLEFLDPGHVSSTLLHFNDAGINAALMSMGDQLLIENGKKRLARDQYDFLKYLGYWTDNGAYYYYRTEPGKNYSDTLLDVGEYLRKENIPAKILQLDSWWYPKSKIDNGVLVWEPIEEMFPEGLTKFQEKLGLKLTFHNRYFAADTPYQDRMDFVFDGNHAAAVGKDKKEDDFSPTTSRNTGGLHPTTREVFDIWAQSVKDWGGVMYEQDWLGTQINRVDVLRKDPYLASNWLRFMSEATDERGLDIQYCMPTINFYFESTRYQNVSNIRSSGDYQERFSGQSQKLWWEHMYTSPLIWAVGAYPFKDVFITKAPEEEIKDSVQKRYFVSSTGTSDRFVEDATLYEPYNHQNALISILSAGPVGIGDRIGDIDRDIVMLITDEDGILIKPDKPLVPTDSMYYIDPRNTSNALVGTTSSTVSGNTWYYVFAINVNDVNSRIKYEFDATELPLDGDYVIYEFMNDREATPDGSLNARKKLEYGDFVYYVLAPLSENGRALIGDAGKYVTASSDRIASWQDSPGAMAVEMKGPKESPVKLVIYSKTAPVKVTDSARGGEFARVGEKDELNNSGTWTQTGKNLYTIAAPGADGEIISIVF